MAGGQRLEDVFPVPDETKKLLVFLGNWSGEGTLTYLARTFRLKGSAKFTPVASGWGVQSEIKLEIEGLGLYDEVDLLGFDRNEKAYHFFALTNTGALYDHKGKWLDDNTLNLFYEGSQNCKKYTENLQVQLKNSNELSVMEKDFLDEKLMTSMEVNLKKC